MLPAPAGAKPTERELVALMVGARAAEPLPKAAQSMETLH
jgi:hypothetical protein